MAPAADAATAAPSLNTASDRELATGAAHGAPGAFDSLYRRHIQPAWRLAHAVGASIDDASVATTEGFVRALRDVRRDRRDAPAQFQSRLLAAVFRATLSAAHPRSGHDPQQEAISAGLIARAPAAGTVLPPIDPLLVAAFRNLPERWRAALWLMDVEGMTAGGAGTVIGVSAAAAVQLYKRGHAGLDHRLAQAGRPPAAPDLAAALSAVVAPVPAPLAAATEAKWKKAIAADRRRSVPAAGWLIERAPTPLTTCAVGLCAAGIIGAAIIGQGRDNSTHTAPTGQIVASPPAGALAFPNGSLRAGTATPTGPGTTAPPAATIPPVATDAGPVGAGPVNVTNVAGGGRSDTVPVTILQPSGPLPTAPVTPVPVVVTIPPPTTAPPSVAPPTTLPVAIGQPVLQASTRVGGLARANVGLGTGSCTGISLLGVDAGCTKAAGGAPLGLTVIGTPILR